MRLKKRHWKFSVAGRDRVFFYEKRAYAEKKLATLKAKAALLGEDGHYALHELEDTIFHFQEELKQ